MRHEAVALPAWGENAAGPRPAAVGGLLWRTPAARL